MAHQILEEMYAGRESAWHHIGYVNKDLLLARDAIDAGGMNFHISKVPLFATLDDLTIEFGQFGLLRGPTKNDPLYVPLGVCGSDYDYYQNHEIADRVDHLVESTGWKFSTAGVLGKGETIFICLEMGKVKIGNDEITRYFTYMETRNGKMSAFAIISYVRVVCKNTLDLALNTATSKIKIRHHAEYKLESDWIMTVMSEAERAGVNLDKALSVLPEIQVNDALLRDMLDACVPMPSMPNLLTMPNLTGRMAEKRKQAEYVYEQKIKLAGRGRDKIIENYSTARDVDPEMRGTGWHAFQAVTEYTTHQHGTLGDRGRKATSASRAEWDLFGGGLDMRTRAYESLVVHRDLFDL